MSRESAIENFKAIVEQFNRDFPINPKAAIALLTDYRSAIAAADAQSLGAFLLSCAKKWAKAKSAYSQRDASITNSAIGMRNNSIRLSELQVAEENLEYTKSVLDKLFKHLREMASTLDGAHKVSDILAFQAGASQVGERGGLPMGGVLHRAETHSAPEFRLKYLSLLIRLKRQGVAVVDIKPLFEDQTAGKTWGFWPSRTQLRINPIESLMLIKAFSLDEMQDFFVLEEEGVASFPEGRFDAVKEYFLGNRSEIFDAIDRVPLEEACELYQEIVAIAGTRSAERNPIQDFFSRPGKEYHSVLSGVPVLCFFTTPIPYVVAGQKRLEALLRQESRFSLK